jgi:hypothetical protein
MMLRMSVNPPNNRIVLEDGYQPIQEIRFSLCKQLR